MNDTVKDPNCETCALSTSTENLLLETPLWRIVLAPDQAYLGRSYVILRNHKASLTELSREEWQDFEVMVKRIEQGYEKAFGSGRPFNWACQMNNAFKETNPTPHVHWHVRPRHPSPITIDDVTFTDPEYAHHYDRARKQYVAGPVLQAIQARILENL